MHPPKVTHPEVSHYLPVKTRFRKILQSTLMVEEYTLSGILPPVTPLVQQACSTFPISACHRVIGSDESLVGFGGGPHKKKWLMDLESQPVINYPPLK